MANLSLQSSSEESEIFSDNFSGTLAQGWTWVREDPDSWRLSNDDGLVIHTLVGGMWTESQEPPRNILIRGLQSSEEHTSLSTNLPSTYAVEVSVKLRPEIWGMLYFLKAAMMPSQLQLLSQT